MGMGVVRVMGEEIATTASRRLRRPLLGWQATRGGGLAEFDEPFHSLHVVFTIRTTTCCVRNTETVGRIARTLAGRWTPHHGADTTGFAKNNTCARQSRAAWFILSLWWVYGTGRGSAERAVASKHRRPQRVRTANNVLVMLHA